MIFQIEPADSEVILKAYKSYHPVIITSPSHQPQLLNFQSSIKNCYKMHNIIGIFRETRSIQPSQWRSFYGSNCWNSAAPIAIWITHFADLNDLQQLLAEFWHNNSINVVLLVLDKLKNKTIAYTYDPFAFKVKTKFGNRERGKLYEITGKEATLFPDKLKNLNGYSIPISLYQHQPHARLNNDSIELADGKDVNYCRFLSQWMNFSIALKTAKVPLINYIVNLPNKTRVNVIGDIITNRSIFIGNAVHWEIINTAVVDIVYPQWRSKIVVVVPSNDDPIPGIVTILHSNSGLTLVLILIAIIALTLFLMIRKEDDIMMKILKLLLFQIVNRIGEKSPARIFWISLIYWAFLLVTIFQSQLINDLSAPEFYDEIDSLDELDKSNLTLMTKEWEWETLNSSKLESKRRLLDQAVVEVDFRKCMSLMEKFRNVACSIDGSYAKFIKSQNTLQASNENYNASKKANFHFLDEPLVSFWKTYAVKKDSPFLAKMNKAAIRLVEKGIMKKWYNDDVKKNLKIQPNKPLNSNIGMDHYRGVFLIYLFGNLVAGGCFLVEVVHYRLRIKNRLQFSCI